MMALNNGVSFLLPGEQSLHCGRNLNGGVYLDLGGGRRLDLRPDQALKLADGIFKALGIEVDYGYGGPKI